MRKREMKKLRKKQFHGNYSDFEFQEFVEDIKQYKKLAISVGLNEEIKITTKTSNKKNSFENNCNFGETAQI
jgi:hypothetical protein